jgi:hypothetical protein
MGSDVRHASRDAVSAKGVPLVVVEASEDETRKEPELRTETPAAPL